MERGTREYTLWTRRPDRDRDRRALPGPLAPLALAQDAGDDLRRTPDPDRVHVRQLRRRSSRAASTARCCGRSSTRSLIALIATTIAIVLASFTAYAIARLDFPGKSLVLAGALAIAMFPPISIVGPLFDMWRTLGLYDTYVGLIIPYLTFALPLAIYTLVAFFREIPWELEQAAQVDGATPLQAFRKVIVPLAAPGYVHGGDPRLHLLLERLRVRDHADVVGRVADGPGGARLLHRRRRSSPRRPANIAAAADAGDDPDHHLRADLPAADRRRSDRGRGQGMTPTEKGAIAMADIVLDGSPSASPTATRPSRT